MRSRLPIVAVSLLFALLTLLPYALAYTMAGDFRFMGFLLNPYDGASYLAKMRQGWEGDWLFRLAFTENPGPGAFLFTFYLALGHLARLVQLPLIAVWHAARILGCVAFLLSAWEFFHRLGFSVRERKLAWLLTALGSGFGWMAILFGGYTSDLWVPEFVPFLGMLTSAHFPLAMALLLLLIMQIVLPKKPISFGGLLGIFLMACALTILQPFGILPLGCALVGWTIWHRLAKGRIPFGAVPGLLAAGLGVLPWAVYDVWAIQTLPALASWSAQNLTPTPPLWDVALATGVSGLVCLFVLVRVLWSKGELRRNILNAESSRVLLILWAALNLFLLYLPFPLQRRLMLGWMIPLVALATPHLARWIWSTAASWRRLVVVFLLIPLSNFVVLAAILQASQSRNPVLYFTRGEAAAVDWLAANAAPGSVVLASPELSLWLPGAAGVRVLYGHPMETPDAEESRTAVERFLSSNDGASLTAFLYRHEVDYILFGPRERQFGGSLEGLPLIEQAKFEDLVVYRALK